MKRNFYLVFLFASLFSVLHVAANTVTVKGSVKFANGSAAKNTEVRIAVFLAGSTTPCTEQVVLTNDNGLYSKELSCQGDILGSRVSVKNCNGSTLVQEKVVPATKIVEGSFIVCLPPPAVCAAKFLAGPVAMSSTVPAFSFKFNSNISEVGAGDNIVERKWDFRDGTALLYNQVDPLHTFPRAGTYEVCLSIKTAKGCESRVCKQITVASVPVVACAARFTFERLAPKKFRFNSTASAVSAGDVIVERKWDFKDGSTSNEASPEHEFLKAGNYEVCLVIKTAKGCESRFCSVVKVAEVTTPQNEPIKILSLYPAPAHENLKVVIGSRHNNVLATIAIVNGFAITQSSRQVTLFEGFNPFTLNVSSLAPGSYFIKVVTQYGTITKGFFKN